MEAANFAARYYPHGQAFVARKTAQVNRTLAIKALANKLCPASLQRIPVISLASSKAPSVTAGAKKEIYLCKGT